MIKQHRFFVWKTKTDFCLLAIEAFLIWRLVYNKQDYVNITQISEENRGIKVIPESIITHIL